MQKKPIPILDLKSKEAFFQVMGLNTHEAKLLALVISKPEYTLADFIKKLEFTRTEFQRILNSLTRSNKIDITQDNKIRISSEFAIEQSRLFDIKTSQFSTVLKETRFLITEKYIEEIEDIFKMDGYRISRNTAVKNKTPYFPEASISDLSYKFIAKKFYRLGIFIISQAFLKIHTGLKISIYLKSLIEEHLTRLENEFACLGSVILIDPRLDKKYTKMLLNQFSRANIDSLTSRPNHIKFVYYQDRSVQSFITSIMNDIENTRETIDERFKDLKLNIRKTRDLIVESSMMISQLDSLTSGKYLPQNYKQDEMSRYMPHIKSVVGRETRNLEIFNRRFEEERAIIERDNDDYDKRFILPNVRKLRDSYNKLNRLQQKFNPIRHELRSLVELILYPYIRGKDPMKINPFILTEPNTIESFTVNQDRIKRSSIRFYKRLKSNGENLLFIVGKAGSGKTHALKNIFFHRAHQEKFWPIYIDCPMKYDIISSLFVEIIKENNFPETLRDYIKAISKQRVSSEYELINVLKNLNDLVNSEGYNGIIFLIDELENSLPYTYDIKYNSRGDKDENAIALKQLKEILSSELMNNIGFIISFRDHILKEVISGLKISNFDDYKITPEKLNEEHFDELIQNRIRTWNSKSIAFNKNVISEIVNRTDSNTRYTIQYFRALYENARKKNRKRITLKLLDSIGGIPLFEY